MNRKSDEYLSLLAPEFVGRTKILNKIQDVVKDSGELPQVFYLKGMGGMGKTRLLDEVLEQIRTGEEWHNLKVISAQRLVDLYHFYTHSDEGFAEDVVDALKPQAGEFEDYFEKRKNLNQAKSEVGGFDEIEKRRDEMMAEFINDLANFSPTGKKVVLALDTAENLIFAVDPVQEKLDLQDLPAGFADWFIEKFLPGAKNCIILLAGRHHEAPELEKKLKKLQASKKLSLILEELKPFSEEESLEYFSAVEDEANKYTENPRLAERFKKITNETRRVVHYLSGGRPFLLALFVDHVVSSDTILYYAKLPLDEVKREYHTPEQLEAIQLDLEESILESIQKENRKLDEMITYLGYARKGMGAELLAWIRKGVDEEMSTKIQTNMGESLGEWIRELKPPSDQEISAAEEDLENLHHSGMRMSFIKEGRDRIFFLQDEMYKTLGKKNPALKVLAAINAFYRHKVHHKYDQIRQLQKESITEKIDVQEKLNQIRLQRYKLHQYRVERIYYELQLDALTGFERYYQYAEEAYRNNESAFWQPLKDEMLKFLHQKPKSATEINTGSGCLKVADIRADLDIRWIKDLIARGKNEIALDKIKVFRDHFPELLSEGTFAKIELNSVQATALVYLGKDLDRCEEIIDDSLNVVQSIKGEQEFGVRRKRLLEATLLGIQGYLYRTQGKFHTAIDPYLQALKIWRKLRLEPQAAEVLNNLAWAEAEAGYFNRAIWHCEDGLGINQDRGQRNAVGLSLNTLGLIETRMGLPYQARRRIKKAMETFQDLQQKRGDGLAQVAMAEALRRSTNVLHLQNDEEILKDLNDANKHANDAVSNFNEKQSSEPLRLIEAYIEQGCTNRELALVTFKKIQQLDNTSQQERQNLSDELNVMKNKSQAALTAAAELAEKRGYIYRAVDARINLAWMWHYVEEDDEALKIIKEVRETIRGIDERYLFSSKKGVQEIEDPISWYWVQLGKAELLRGRISYSNYSKLNKKADTKTDVDIALLEKHLTIVGKAWALAMAYNARYGSDFRDLNRAMGEIYSRMIKLNSKEQKWVSNGMQQAYDEYHFKDYHNPDVNLRIFQTQIFETLMLPEFGE